MSFFEVFLLGIGLSMDAFAVSLCKGLSMKKLNIKGALVIAGFFGGFQAIMPLTGWLLGMSFEKYITEIDHWIAFGLLAIIGGKMIIDAVKEMKAPDEAPEDFKLKIGELFLLAIATSIDALAVGLTFAFLNMSAGAFSFGQLNIWCSILLIGCTTFVISFAGVNIGFRFGNRFQAKAELAGGAVLVLLGIKILLEHLGFINF